LRFRNSAARLLFVHLINLETFVCVAELGSLAAAARALDLPKSTVSRRIESLEAELGVALLSRRGRRLSLTDHGRALSERCAVSLRELRGVEESLMDLSSGPSGKLSVAMPVEASASPGLISLVAEFASGHPNVQVDLRAVRINQSGVALLEEGIDLVFQFSPVGFDAELLPSVDHVVARPLGRVTGGLFASRGYLDAQGEPRTIAELTAHRCLSAPDGPFARRWVLRSSSGQEELVEFTPAMTSNETLTIIGLILGHAGIALLPSHSSHPYVQQGVMKRVLPRWSPPPLHLHLLWVRSRHLAPRIRAFVDHMQSRTGDVEWLS
jgi:DNA-binding transcriptional LysR family regulator